MPGLRCDGVEVRRPTCLKEIEGARIVLAFQNRKLKLGSVTICKLRLDVVVAVVVVVMMM